MRFATSLAATVVSAGLCGVSPSARAATSAVFTQEAFAAAEAQNRPILVDISASWCSTCARQRAILSRLVQAPEFRNLTIYTIDFDTQKKVVRQFGAQNRSTLIVFHGDTERGRSVGDTDAASIKALLQKANG